MAHGLSTKIISMIKWIRTSRVSIQNSLSASKRPPAICTIRCFQFCLLTRRNVKSSEEHAFAHICTTSLVNVNEVVRAHPLNLLIYTPSHTAMHDQAGLSICSSYGKAQRPLENTVPLCSNVAACLEHAASKQVKTQTEVFH